MYSPVLNTIRYLTDEDQIALGRHSVNTTLVSSFTSGWKVGIRVRNGVDYHFMKRNWTDPFWEFKAGVLGFVLRIRNNATPSDITWDIYAGMYGNVAVYNSGYYNSSIYYSLIY